MAGFEGWRELNGKNLVGFGLSVVGKERLDLVVLVVHIRKHILLVSFEFHMEWHEDQYKQIKENVVTSDDFEKIGKTSLFARYT
jgi:hypothetical protein